MLAARLSDTHTCPLHGGGPILQPCEPTVLIGYLPAARVTDLCVCCGFPIDAILKASLTVFTGYLPQARVSDPTAHGGMITIGCPTVQVGG